MDESLGEFAFDVEQALKAFRTDERYAIEICRNALRIVERRERGAAQKAAKPREVPPPSDRILTPEQHARKLAAMRAWYYRKVEERKRAEEQRRRAEAKNARRRERRAERRAAGLPADPETPEGAEQRRARQAAWARQRAEERRAAGQPVQALSEEAMARRRESWRQHARARREAFKSGN